MYTEITTVTSADGTSIAYDRVGHGPALLVIGAGPVDRSVNAPLAQLLGAEFTVYNYDRRGRGGSGDTAPYDVSREFEDIQAVIDVAGGSAHIFGTSGGGAIALEAAARGMDVTRLVVWEPPYIVAGTRPPAPPDYRQQLIDLLAENRRGDMVGLFFTVAGLPAEFIAQMRQSPFWPDMEKIAHALVYDATMIGDFSVPTARLAAVDTVPTMVIDGGTTPWVTAGADAVAAAVSGAHRRTLTGQPHNVDPAAIAPAIAEFLTT